MTKAATFEGATPDALVTDALVDYHLAVARGGAGMITVAYLAVAPEGRTHRHQIYLRDEAVPGLQRLTEAVHDEGAAVAAQLGYAGPVANGRSNRSHALSASRLLNPMYLLRGDAPRREFATAMPFPVSLGVRLLGRRFLREYPFEEAFLLPYARRFRAALTMPLILLGGVNRRDTVQAMAEGFAYVAMARALLREPDLVNRMRRGNTEAGVCIHCNRCMPTIYTGTHCPVATKEARA